MPCALYRVEPDGPETGQFECSQIAAADSSFRCESQLVIHRQRTIFSACLMDTTGLSCRSDIPDILQPLVPIIGLIMLDPLRSA